LTISTPSPASKLVIAKGFIKVSPSLPPIIDLMVVSGYMLIIGVFDVCAERKLGKYSRYESVSLI